jgi:uncharacterized protein YqjF (DUF2071 family)
MFDGRAWVGIVPFTMWGVRPYLLPPVPGLSSFHELNVRTYVQYEGVPGVWFMSMDANSALSVWGARQFFYLPYFNARINLSERGQTINYSSRRTQADAPTATFDAEWTYGELLAPSEPGSLPFFLTERYCLYSAYREQLYRCRVHHRPWPLRRAEVSAYNSTLLEALGLPALEGEPLLHYADALKTDIWPLERLSAGSREHAFEHASATETFG